MLLPIFAESQDNETAASVADQTATLEQAPREHEFDSPEGFIRHEAKAGKIMF